jgi:hypothetical protein
MPCVARWQCLGETDRAPRHLSRIFSARQNVLRPRSLVAGLLPAEIHVAAWSR